MKTFLMIMMTIALGLNVASASMTKEFNNYGDSLSKSVADLGQALAEDTSYVLASKSKWYMDAIWLKVDAAVGVSIPGIVGLKFIPSIEFFLKRKAPAGYELDKP